MPALLLVVAGVVFAGPPQPVIAWWVVQHDVRPPTGKPWRELSELPRLVAYDDGLVLLTSSEGETKSVTLTPAERAALFDAGGSAFFSLDDRYEGTRQLHPPVHLITRWSGKVRKTVRFFGTPNEPAERAHAPEALQHALDTLGAFAPTRLTQWSPEQFQLRVCPTKAPPMTPAWPEGWPLPEAGTPSLVGSGCLSLLLPAAQRQRAEGLVRKGESFTTIRHQGATWLVTLERPVFPEEMAWAGH